MLLSWLTLLSTYSLSRGNSDGGVDPYSLSISAAAIVVAIVVAVVVGWVWIVATFRAVASERPRLSLLLTPLALAQPVVLVLCVVEAQISLDLLRQPVGPLRTRDGRPPRISHRDRELRARQRRLHLPVALRRQPREALEPQEPSQCTRERPAAEGRVQPLRVEGPLGAEDEA